MIILEFLNSLIFFFLNFLIDSVLCLEYIFFLENLGVLHAKKGEHSQDLWDSSFSTLLEKFLLPLVFNLIKH